jgi:hypothetical protein
MKPLGVLSSVAAFSFLCLAALFAAAQAKAPDPYSVYGVKAISNNRVLPSTVFHFGELDKPLLVTLCPGEYEPTSFAIRAWQNLTDLTVQASDLHSGPNSIAASHVDVKTVKLWYRGCSNGIEYTHCPGGPQRVLLPELLLKDDRLVAVDRGTQTNWLRVNTSGAQSYIDISKVGHDFSPQGGPDETLPPNVSFDDSLQLKPISINEGDNQQFWVTVYAPPDAAPGVYDGTIEIRTNNASLKTIGLSVNILPFKLDPPAIEYGLYYRSQLVTQTPERVGHDFKNEIEYKAEMEDIVKHGVVSATITQSYDPGDRRLFEKCLDIRSRAGLKRSLYMLWTGQYFDNIVKARQLVQFVRSQGYNEVYFYGGDELRPDQAAARRTSWQRIQSIGGKVFSSVNEPYGVADVLDLAIAVGKRELRLAALYHSKGHKVFSSGVPQVGLEEPETYRRSYGIALWKSGYDGAMLYAYQHGFGCIWNDFDGYFRDHVFAYPTTNGVIDTIQWEGFREGIDDVRYLTTLLNMIARAKAQGISTDTAERWVRAIDTSRDLDQIRSEMVGHILSLISALNKTPQNG